MGGPLAFSYSSAPMTYLVLSAVLITTCSMASATPRDRSQFFTTCWGWGAGCSMHSAVGRALSPPMVNRPIRRHESSNERTLVGIPSMVTSGTWEPGTMGKRGGSRRQRQNDLLAFLERAADGDKQHVRERRAVRRRGSVNVNEDKLLV